MPRRCSVFGCSSNYDSAKETCTTFCLPRDKKLCQVWLRRIPTDFSKLKNPVVCIKHFDESSIIRNDTLMVNGEMKVFQRERLKLKDGSVPSIFPSTPCYLGISFKKISRKKLKPTLHNIYKSQKYQPRVVLHRLPKSVLDNYIGTVYEPYFEKTDLETSEDTFFKTCGTLSEIIDTEESRIIESPLQQKIPLTVRTTNTMNGKNGGSTLERNKTLGSNLIYRDLLPHRSHDEMVKDLNDILSTVEDAVIAENKLLSTVEDALLGESPLASPESSDHLEGGEIHSPFVHAIKKENIDMNVSPTKSKAHLTEERIDRDTSIDEPSVKSSAAFESDGFHNNSEHSHSGGELSLPPSPRPWLTPKIVSVLSMAAQSAGGSNERISPSGAERQKISKQIHSSKSFTEISPTILKPTNVPKISSPLYSKEMLIISKLFKSKMKDSLSKLMRVVSQVSRVISLQECCGEKCVELQKVVNDLDIDDDLFSKLSIIIKDSVQESEHYNENAKYILQLISSYSRGEKESETSVQ